MCSGIRHNNMSTAGLLHNARQGTWVGIEGCWVQTLAALGNI